MRKKTLWSRNYCLLMLASVMGAAGGIAGGYALSFLVYDETGSTLAAGLLIAIRVIPQFFLPILIAPLMDRLPRKPFLVGGDLIGGVLFAFAGLYLKEYSFSYIGYLLFSLILACVNSLDSLAYNSIFPSIIPQGFEEKGYTVSGMLYPVMTVLIMPVAAILMDIVGTANILLIQSFLSILAAIIESRIRISECSKIDSDKLGLSLWWKDFCDGFSFLKGEKGLINIYAYMSVTNGIAMGYGPILVAFFRTAPGFTTLMYSFFTAAEFIGRTLGGLFQYHVKIPDKGKFRFTFIVYQIYETMDMILLWLPYPFMLINRAVCGFLGINSATIRNAAIQRYLPEEYRSRVNAVQEAAISAIGSIFALLIGAMGEMLDQRTTVTIAASVCMIVCWLTIWRNRKNIKKIFAPSEGE